MIPRRTDPFPHLKEMASGFPTLISRAADALYYLDLDSSHQASKLGIIVPSSSRAFRIATVPSDAETTGPAFNSDMTAIFLSVQRPIGLAAF